MVVDLEEILLVAQADHFAAPDRVGESLGHAGRLDVALLDIAIEEAGPSDVSRLEQSHERREPREAFRIGIGTADEREDLELALEVRAVVSEHVHEVVLREVLGCTAGGTGEREAAADVHLPDRMSERFRRQLLEG